MNSFRAKLSMIFVRLYVMSLECSARDYFNITNLSRLVQIMEFRFFVYLGVFCLFRVQFTIFCKRTKPVQKNKYC